MSRSIRNFFLFLSCLFCVSLFPRTAQAQSGWNLIFSDEFNGTNLNTSVWTTTYPGGGQCTQQQEAEVYEPGALAEAGGVLTITTTNNGAYADDGGGFICPGPWESGLIQSNGSNTTFTYGYFEAREKIPSGAGFWPAFWLYATSGYNGPEIDIMEMLNTATTTVYQTYHPFGGGQDQNAANSSIDCHVNYCDFAVDWEPGSLTFYLNGVATYTYTGGDVSSTAMYVVSNLAVGGGPNSFPGPYNGSTPSPSNMLIDYIRVYQHPNSGNGCYSNIPGPTPIPTEGCGGVVSVSPSSLSFGNVVQSTTSSSQSVSVTNNSGAPITMGLITLVGPNASDFGVPTNGCTGSVPNGQSCTATVNVRPTAAPGTAESATMDISFTGQPGSPLAVSLSATSISGAPVTTHYSDYVTGSDSNSGTSEGSPWKHVPGMLGLTPTGSSTGDGCVANCAAYTPVAGDKIILKAGTVWPYTTAPWTFTQSGSSSSQLYGCAGPGCIYIGNAVGAGLPAWNSGTVTSITLTRDLGGWSPASPPTISCSGGGGSGAAATSLIVPAANTDANISGFIYHINLTSGGSGYTSAPTCGLLGGGTATLSSTIDDAIFDLGATQGSPPDWPVGQYGNFPNTYNPGLVSTGSYVLLNGIEVRNMRAVENTLGGLNDLGVSMVNLGPHSTASNLYVHGMFVDCYYAGSCSASGYDVSESAIGVFNTYDEAANNIVENGDSGFLGNSTQQSNNICNNGSFCTAYEFGIQTTTQGGLGPVSVHGNVSWMNAWQQRLVGNDASGSDPFLAYNNEYWLTSYLINYGAHINSRYTQLIGPATLISYNNVVHSEVGGTSSQIQCPSGVTFYYFNEVQWNIGTGTQPYSADMNDVGGTGGCTMILYNDTMYASNGGACINSQTGTNVTVITMQNLQCISTSLQNPFWSSGVTNSVYQNSAGSTSAATVQASSVVQSISTANGQGYKTTNMFQPTLSSNDTVTFASNPNSANLTSLCTAYLAALCQDINGVSRPTTGGWQAGYSQLGGTPPPTPPNAPTGLIATITGGGGGGGSLAYVSDVQGSTYNNSPAGMATDPLSVITGNNLIGFCALDNSTDFTASTTFTDTAGNLFARVAGATNKVDDIQVITFEAFNVTGNASDVGTCNPSGGVTGYVEARMVQFSGGVKAHDTAAVGGYSLGGGLVSTFTTGSFSTANANEGVACFGNTNDSVATGQSATPGTGYTLTAKPDSFGISSMQYQSFSATQSNVTASMFWSKSTTGVIGCDVIK